VSFTLPGTLKYVLVSLILAIHGSKSPLQGKQHLTTFLPTSRFSRGVEKQNQEQGQNQKIRAKPEPESECFFLSFDFALPPKVRNVMRSGRLGGLVCFSGAFRAMDGEGERYMDVLERPQKS